jgi:hypothetical protein
MQAIMSLATRSTVAIPVRAARIVACPSSRRTSHHLIPRRWPRVRGHRGDVNDGRRRRKESMRFWQKSLQFRSLSVRFGMAPSFAEDAGKVTLQRTGATFPVPLYQRWFSEHKRAHCDLLGLANVTCSSVVSSPGPRGGGEISPSALWIYIGGELS